MPFGRSALAGLITAAAALVLVVFNVPSFAQSNDLAELDSQFSILFRMRYYSDAALIGQRALIIREQTLGPDHIDVGQSLNNLASAYLELGRYAEAEPLFKRALVIREKNLGPDDPRVAATVNNLASVYN